MIERSAGSRSSLRAKRPEWTRARQARQVGSQPAPAVNDAYYGFKGFLSIIVLKSKGNNDCDGDGSKDASDRGQYSRVVSREGLAITTSPL